MKVLGIQLDKPTSGYATVFGVLCTLGLIALLYWGRAAGLPVGLPLKVMASANILWIFITGIFGVRVMGGWQQSALYLVGFVVVNVLTAALLAALV